MKKIRLDKFIAQKLYLTRSQASKLLKSKSIKVNNIIITHNIDIDQNDIVKYNDEIIEFKDKYIYLALNKPQGYICANHDKNNATVFDLLPEKYSRIKDIHTVGRLDKDTTGLLLITNDGELTHELLAPKKHVVKTYLVTVDKPLQNHLVPIFANGFDIDNDEKVKPSKLEILSPYQARLQITEGKYHQVKRMFARHNYEVVQLHRESFGYLTLEKLNLEIGQYKEISKDEILGH
ncbi:pseudouridine synthase [Mycoplasmopsis verecunda]|uniref:Pseudouridine synthase n=1 Tax=Mycoplasmopsis verecunda TaxID=171291 RepID=A0A1T4L2B3_9BACT|nr:pseudouridine synthase [Mycoplasmopsis verecunda]WPB54377.1 pseudouridine synthase [Mycoplasmopsis verecunda]SJZ48677.1 16S rRNA pseudouridine516 synthase [Mycoplasmopsis verecunda]